MQKLRLEGNLILVEIETFFLMKITLMAAKHAFEAV